MPTQYLQAAGGLAVAGFLINVIHKGYLGKLGLLFMWSHPPACWPRFVYMVLNCKRESRNTQSLLQSMLRRSIPPLPLHFVCQSPVQTQK